MKRIILFIALFAGATLCAHVVRAQSGIITTVAGGGSSAGTDGIGDGGAATAAELFGAAYVVSDGTGNFYISDQDNRVVRKVNPYGIISTVAGNGTNGYSGDSGQATVAQLSGL